MKRRRVSHAARWRVTLAVNLGEFSAGNILGNRFLHSSRLLPFCFYSGFKWLTATRSAREGKIIYCCEIALEIVDRNYSLHDNKIAKT